VGPLEYSENGEECDRPKNLELYDDLLNEEVLTKFEGRSNGRAKHVCRMRSVQINKLKPDVAILINSFKHGS